MWKIQGTANISTEFYGSTKVDTNKPHDPSLKAIIFSTVHLSDKIKIPISIYLTSQSRSSQFTKHQQPFNQIGASPVFFKWLTLHAGYFSTKLSDLSFGEHTILGGGVEKTDGIFRFSLLYGRMRAAIEPDLSDSDNIFLGEFKRTGLAFKIGIGNKEKTFLDLNIAKIYDDSSSISLVPDGLQPYENAVTSLSFGISLFKDKVIVRGEASFSTFSNDTRAEVKDVPIGPLNLFFTPRYSSQYDGAAFLSIKYKPTINYYFDLESRWIGPGYVTLSYPQLQNDIFENTLKTNLNLFENKLFLNASATFAVNDLRGTRFAISKTISGTLSSVWKPSDKFSLNLQYFQYSIRSVPEINSLKYNISTRINDTTVIVDTIEVDGNQLAIDSKTISISLSPTYYFNLSGGVNSLTLEYTYREIKDNNDLASAFNQSSTHNIRGIWAVSLPSSLFLSACGGFISNKTGKQETTIGSVCQSAAYSFLKNKLNIVLSIGYNMTGSNDSHNQLYGNLNGTYSLDKWGQLNLTASLNSLKYDSNIYDFSEQQVTLQYIYNF